MELITLFLLPLILFNALTAERMDTYRGNVPEGRLEPVRRERRTGREKPRGTQTVVAGRDQGAAADAADPGEGGSGLGVPAWSSWDTQSVEPTDTQRAGRARRKKNTVTQRKEKTTNILRDT